MSARLKTSVPQAVKNICPVLCPMRMSRRMAQDVVDPSFAKVSE